MIGILHRVITSVEDCDADPKFKSEVHCWVLFRAHVTVYVVPKIVSASNAQVEEKDRPCVAPPPLPSVDTDYSELTWAGWWVLSDVKEYGQRSTLSLLSSHCSQENRTAIS